MRRSHAPDPTSSSAATRPEAVAGGSATFCASWLRLGSVLRSGPEHHTLEIQRARIQRTAPNNSYELVDVLTDENHSGRSRNRPQFGIAMQRILVGEADAIIAWKLSRFSRNWWKATEDPELLESETTDREPTYELLGATLTRTGHLRRRPHARKPGAQTAFTPIPTQHGPLPPPASTGAGPSPTRTAPSREPAPIPCPAPAPPFPRLEKLSGVPRPLPSGHARVSTSDVTTRVLATGVLLCRTNPALHRPRSVALRARP